MNRPAARVAEEPMKWRRENGELTMEFLIRRVLRLGRVLQLKQCQQEKTTISNSCCTLKDKKEARESRDRNAKSRKNRKDVARRERLWQLMGLAERGIQPIRHPALF